MGFEKSASDSRPLPFLSPWIAVLFPMHLVIHEVIGPLSMLEAVGPNAELLEDIWWLMFWTSVPIYLFTVGLLIYAIVRSRRRNANVDPQEIHYSSILAGGGIVLPVLVVVPLAVITVLVGNEVTTGDEEESLVIEVVGHQWWWEVHYPEAGVFTANEIHIPVDRPVQVRLISADVIHSFWVPQLAGKIDLVPGSPNTLWLEASEPGTFRGRCTEFCGIQHANMRFLVVADEPSEFEAWLENQAQPAVEPTDPLAQQGRDLFVESNCALCHTVRGVNEVTRGEIDAPDLTHIASRQEIAAGARSNTPGNMGGWILDPQNIKPGNHMHATSFEPDQLHAMIAYLESLE